MCGQLNINTERWQGFAAEGGQAIHNCIVGSRSVPTCSLVKCHFRLQAPTLPLAVGLVQATFWQHKCRSEPGPQGSVLSPGLTNHWPSYCCLWYLLVNFCNQYNISPCSSWEWKPEVAHLILRPAAAPCSAANGAVGLRDAAWLLKGRECVMDGCSRCSTSPSRPEVVIMTDHNCTHKNSCSSFVGLHSDSWRCSTLEQVFEGEGKKKKWWRVWELIKS